jgi:ubiquinone/menaquinone biosynthesis C-methylase UbiE
MMNAIKTILPTPVKSFVRWTRLCVIDGFESLTGRRDALIPPRRLQFVGGGDFATVGNKLKKLLIDLGGLKPDDRVLDVGCGIGRMAVPLVGYLSERGSYDGFDVVPKGIQWCQRNISKGHPNFHFQVADLYNKMYNPKGRFKAGEFPFPYADASFDFVFLTSVFSHLLFDDMEHYISEIARVLRPSGRCFATFFLLNPESEELIKAGASTLEFRHVVGRCRLEHINVPEDAVAYLERDIRALLSKYGLALREPIYYGRWCGRETYTRYQDIVITMKV